MELTSIGAHNRAVGSYGERAAARRLLAEGMVLLDRNWRCESGEIDLVLRDGHVLVVCEVKTRSSTRAGLPHEAVTEDVLLGHDDELRRREAGFYRQHRERRLARLQLLDGGKRLGGLQLLEVMLGQYLRQAI